MCLRRRWRGRAIQMHEVQKMSLKQTACFSCRWLAFWLVLFTVEGKASDSLPNEENKDVKVELTKADDKHIDSTEFPVECSLRKLTKRSSSFDVSWFRDLDSRKTNCQIFPVTTATLPVPTTRTTTKDPRKATTYHPAAASAQEGPQLLYFLPYYPPRQHILYTALFPINRGLSGYNTIWYNKFQRDDSSEEKRRKRDTLAIFYRKGARSL
ncbi:uncharacterized protein LOC128329508 [Hemicordylus capensis]|uniref:uncharacterized protein LOC128329508 n=1 Tax=Hemicordylus capensis TaxID=884348 RepID=UPI00230299FD|nr:uncharacterized protein LOC128329508 [Hemicordylus capensis]XP_053116840.1 uncharacterized protein LOC128329508 [Hemicordylus capensis]XP_053116841.1 uncharacterized protein LOC128329508 [Hemicordylus capensis]XP_053116842.1 uncharacterized protein LOC128329508 [Hemicordylus capensis]